MKNKGLTLVEVIVSIAIIGIVIGPVLNMFYLSASISGSSNREYKSFLAAQTYLEEIKVLDYIDTNKFKLDGATGCYERIIPQTNSEYGAEIRIFPVNNLLYKIEIYIINGSELINSLKGSKIILNK